MDDIKKQIGKRIKELRQKNGFSQQQLAEKIGIDQRSLSYIECGGAFPSKCLMKLAYALKVDLKELFDFCPADLTTQNMKEYIKKSVDELDERNTVYLYKFLNAIK